MPASSARDRSDPDAACVSEPRLPVGSVALESVVSILIGVNVGDSQVSAYLKRFHSDAGFTQYIEIEKADAKTLARLAEFVSQSISAQSQALGKGGGSHQLVF